MHIIFISYREMNEKNKEKKTTGDCIFYYHALKDAVTYLLLQLYRQTFQLGFRTIMVPYFFTQCSKETSISKGLDYETVELFQLFLSEKLSVVSHAVTNILKRVLVVLLLYITGSRSASPMNFLGLGVCTLGLMVYAWTKREQKAPTTNLQGSYCV